MLKTLLVGVTLIGVVIVAILWSVGTDVVGVVKHVVEWMALVAQRV